MTTAEPQTQPLDIRECDHAKQLLYLETRVQVTRDILEEDLKAYWAERDEDLAAVALLRRRLKVTVFGVMLVNMAVIYSNIAGFGKAAVAASLIAFLVLTVCLFMNA